MDKSRRAAMITKTNDRVLPFTLSVGGKEYPFPNYTAAANYARQRFIGYPIIDQTERGDKENGKQD